MGSVPHLYTTGDNDPEIYPSQHYRHYLYCDACGSFELDSWIEPENHEALETARRRLAMAAFCGSPWVVISAWRTLGFEPSLTFLAALFAGICLLLVIWRFMGKVGWVLGRYVPSIWPLPKWAFFMLLIVVVVEWLVGFAARFVPPWVLLLAGVIFTAGLLVAREILGSKIELAGMKCRQCGATYAYGTAFFTDLDANPRGLAVADVPRPLGVSPFEVGMSVDSEPPDPPS